MNKQKKILVTGSTGKVGQNFIQCILKKDRSVHIKALCHNRILEEHPRIEIVKGSISESQVCKEAMAEVSHVIHLATCKETPENVMDVTVKGLFWLLEEARQSSTFERFILIGGDAGVGHSYYPRTKPLTEDQDFKPYPGCYALSKVLEEVMLEQYVTQYNLNTCCLRAPWIMEKDDFKFSLKLGEQQFGGPRWDELMTTSDLTEKIKLKEIPILCDQNNKALLRNFVHVDDLVSAMIIVLDHPDAKQELFHICMNEPLDYSKVATILEAEYELKTFKVQSQHHSTWLDNSKARFRLAWEPKYDTKTLVRSAFDYQRAESDPRKVWYPG